jgi:pimeloyl-ACP methyl ester carboxylesterase
LILTSLPNYLIKYFIICIKLLYRKTSIKLQSIACPTLITAGDIDPVTTIEAAEEMAAHIPDAVKQFEVFENYGHGVHRDDPRVFEVMKAFLTN